MNNALMAGSNKEVFWVSVDGGELNFLAPDDEAHKSFKINKQSAFYTYLTLGNDNRDRYANLPSAYPCCQILMGKRVLIFSRFQYGERPSVCFYSVEQGREVLQCLGAAMFLCQTPDSNAATEQENNQFLFYANPIFCSQIIPDRRALNGKFREIRDSKTLGENAKIPVMKLERLDIGSAMEEDETVKIDLQRDWPQLEADLKDKTLE